MVVNPMVERPGSGQMDYLLNRLGILERQVGEQGARSTFPFSIGHSGVRDFSVEPSASGDGTADIYIGDGAGGKLIQITTDALYHTKILRMLDQSGASMMSTDALAGYGLGTPSYAFPFSGFAWNTTLGGAIDHATAREIGRGGTFVYNPAVYLNPYIRISSATAETVKVFVQFKDSQGNLNETTDQTMTVTAGGVTTLGPGMYFGKNWDADDMNRICYAFFKAYVVGGTPGNVSIGMGYSEGYGVSQRFFSDNAVANWAV